MEIDILIQELEEKLKEISGIDEINYEENLSYLGVNSIMIMKIASFLKKKSVAVKFGELIENPTFGEWVKLVRKKGIREKVKDKKNKAEVKENQEFELTDVQYAYWAGRQDDQVLGGVACHAYFEFDRNSMDVDRLKEAYRTVQKAHPMLRVLFTKEGRQKFEDNEPLELVVNDYRKLDEEAIESKLEAIRNRMSHEKLKVEEGENTHLEIALLPGDKQRLYLDIDLLVADVASVHLVIADLTRAYRGQEIKFYDKDCFFKYLEQKKAEETSFKEDEAYWLKAIKDFPEEAINLPMVKQPDEIKRTHFVRKSKKFEKSKWDAIKQKAKDYGISPAMFLLTAYNCVLSRYSNSEKFVINIPLFNRDEDIENAKGMVADFTNLLLLDVQNSAHKTFLDYAGEIKKNFNEKVSHAAYSGVAVEREISKHTGSYDSIAPVVFACNIDFPFETRESSETLGKLTYMISQTPQVWLDFQSFEDMGNLLLCWDYVEELFDSRVISDMFDSMTELVDKLAASGNWEVEIDTLPEKQKRRHQLEETLDLGQAPKDFLYQFFRTYAKETKENTAIIDVRTKKKISYGQLDGIARKVAGYLIENGVKPNSYVAVTLPRGYRQIMAILGVLYAGAVYVPVSVNQPKDRRTKIYEQIGIEVVLTDKATIEKAELTEKKLCDLDAAIAYANEIERPVDISVEDSAYVIMTSGSTGVPKGVEITHCQAMNTIEYLNDKYVFNKHDSCLMVSAVDFDLSVFDMFGTLNSGGTIVSLDEDNFKNPDVWLDSMEEFNITRWNSVPILFDMLVTYAEGKKADLNLKTVFLSGDWIPINLPSRFYKKTNIDSVVVAMGGATEASIWSNYLEVPKEIPKDWPSIPYGRPLENQLYRVVDNYGRICPDYVAGELNIGGAGVAKCYRGDAKLTAGKFYKNEDGIRWYRTGDNGRTWEDGIIEFLGRRDNQVKVKGHRIELGEIENAIKRFEGVRGAIVSTIDYDKNDKKIVAVVQYDDSVDVNKALSKAKINEPELDLNQEKGQAFLRAVNKKTYEFIRNAVAQNKAYKDSDLIKYWEEFLKVNDLAKEDYRDEQTEYFSGIFEQVSDKLPEILSKELNPIEYFYGEGKNLRPDLLLENLYGHKETRGGLENLIEQLVESKKNIKILDIGCRDVSLTESVLGRFKDNISSYICLENTIYYKSLYEQTESNYKAFSYEISDIKEFAEDEGKEYDLVIVANSLHRNRKLAEVASQLKTLVKAGGFLVGCELSSDLNIIDTIPAILENGYKDHDKLPSNEKLMEEFEKAGFTTIYMSSKEEEKALLSKLFVFQMLSKKSFSVEELIEYLKEEVPPYMIPFKVSLAKNLPLTPNGKLDRKKMAQLFEKDQKAESLDGETKVNYSKYQEILVNIFSQLFKSEIGLEDNYFNLGGDSLVATKIIASLQSEYGIKLSIRNIFENPVVKDLASYIENNLDSITCATSTDFEINKDDWNKPFPLTSVQFAYWVGRKGAFSLGSVATHCYFEYQCKNLNIGRLQKAINELIAHHGMLRDVILPDGSQQILEKVSPYRVDVNYLDGFSKEDQNSGIEEIRNEMSKQIINPEKWPLFDFKVSVLSDDISMLHISFDNLILDGFSMFRVLDELANLYKEGSSNLLPQRVSYRDYVIYMDKLRHSKRYKTDQKYWMDRLETFSKAPMLVLNKEEKDLKELAFVRRHGELDEAQWNNLKEISKENGITPTVFLITAYADTLRRYSRNKDFALNLTLFDRPALCEGIDSLVGDFTNLTLLEIINQPNESFLNKAKEIQRQLTADLEHNTFNAIDFQRELRKRDNNSTDSIMPIVFTSGIGVNELSDEKAIGKLVHNVSQTPQVWIDHQVFEINGKLYLNWDSVDELLGSKTTDVMFDFYISYIKTFIKNPVILKAASALEDVVEADQITFNVEIKDEVISKELSSVNQDVVDIWENLLHEEVLDYQKTFFELGGDSLGLVKMVNEINEKFGMELTIVDVMEHNTIADLSELLGNQVTVGVI